MYSFKPIGRQETPSTVVLERFNTTHNIEVLKSDIYIYNFKGETMKRKISEAMLD